MYLLTYVRWKYRLTNEHDNRIFSSREALRFQASLRSTLSQIKSSLFLVQQDSEAFLKQLQQELTFF